MSQKLLTAKLELIQYGPSVCFPQLILVKHGNVQLSFCVDSWLSCGLESEVRSSGGLSPTT